MLLLLNFRSCQKIIRAFLWPPAQILWIGIPYELNQHDRLLRRANYLATYIRLSISSKNAKSSSMSTFLGSLSHTFYHTVKIGILWKGSRNLLEDIKDHTKLATTSSTVGVLRCGAHKRGCLNRWSKLQMIRALYIERSYAQANFLRRRLNLILPNIVRND